MDFFIGLFCLILTVIFVICVIAYLSDHTKFRIIRTLKSQVENSHESSDVKLIFYDNINQNKKLSEKLKSFDTNLYNSNVIKYSLKTLIPTIHQEMRDLISCTGEYSSRLTHRQLENYSKQWEKTRMEILESVLDTKKTDSSIIDATTVENSDLDSILFEIKVKSEHLDSVISNSLCLNSLDLKEKYYLSTSKETKLKIIRQLKDIAHYLDKDIYIIAKQKDNEIINHLNINDRYLKKLETDWNQE